MIADQAEDNIKDIWVNKITQNGKKFFIDVGEISGDSGEDAFAFERMTNSLMIAIFLFVIGVLICTLGIIKTCIWRISNQHDMSAKYVKKSNSRWVVIEPSEQVVFKSHVDYWMEPDPVTRQIMQHNEKRLAQHR